MRNEENLILIALCANVVTLIQKRRLRNKKKESRRTMWVRKWLQRRDLAERDIQSLVFNELRLEDPLMFKNFSRLTPSSFEILLSKVEPQIQYQDTILRQCIPSKARLLLTLRFLATGENFATLCPAFRISVPAISNIISETIPIIYHALRGYLKTPQCKMEWLDISKKFKNLWNFPNCLGALDGKHIAFRASKSDGSMFYNYKGFNSIVLTAAVDAEYKFIYVDVGCNGRISDGGVYAQSSLYQGISANIMDFPNDAILLNDDTTYKAPFVFIADEAFKLTTRMMKPMGKRSNKQERVFNYRLSRARRIVENAFGILANRFQVLQREIKLDVQKVQQITLASCALHNFILVHEGLKNTKIDHENTCTVELQKGNWHSSVRMTHLEPVNSRPTMKAIDVRNEFMRYFNGPGAVSWQEKAIEKFNF